MRLWEQITDKCIRVAGKILVQVGSATEVCHSQIFLHSKSFQVTLTQIPKETLLFRTRLPTRQDGFQNREKAVISSHAKINRSAPIQKR